MLSGVDMGRKRVFAIVALGIAVFAALGCAGPVAQESVAQETVAVAPGDRVRNLAQSVPSVAAVMSWSRPPMSGRANDSRTWCTAGTCEMGRTDHTDPPTNAADRRHDFVAVAFGDSFASGEGAPAVPRGSSTADFAYSLTSPQWPGNLLSLDQFSGPIRCHRSPAAPFTLAMVRMARLYPEVSMAFRSFACSGAEFPNLLEPQQMTFLGYRNDAASNPPQAATAARWLNGVPADMVYVNMGGNDAGFAKVIAACSFTDCSDGPEKEVVSTYTGKVDEVLLDGFSTLGGVLTAPTYRPRVPVVYSLPPFPAAYLANGTRRFCGSDSDPSGVMGFGNIENWFNSSEIALLNDTFARKLFSEMRRRARAAGYRTMQPNFVAHGICATRPFINSAEVAEVIQGPNIIEEITLFPDLHISAGWWHPNAAGYAAWANALYPHLRDEMLSMVTPGPGHYSTLLGADGSIAILLRVDPPARRVSAPGEGAWASGRIRVAIDLQATCRTSVGGLQPRVGRVEFPYFNTATNPRQVMILRNPCGTDTPVEVTTSATACLRSSTRICTRLASTTERMVANTTTTTSTTSAPTTTAPFTVTTAPSLSTVPPPTVRFP
jgi:hypothetical protein